ncbi:MAG: GGDEF domain-containing protein [Tissierellia bacterium]|nr:GGDEF domain-containing protein [Tissierellia bacterium]
MRTRIEELEIENEEAESCITVSLGVASIVPDNEMEPYELIDAADRELYKAKEDGRNKVMVYRV